MWKWMNFYKYLQGSSSSSPSPELDKGVHLIIRRKNVTFYLKMCELTKISILKKMIEPIFKVRPGDQQLFLTDINNPNFENRELFDSKSNLKPCTLFDYNLTVSTAPPECPATVGLAIRKEDGLFENLEITPYQDSADFKEEPVLISECLKCLANVNKNPVIKLRGDMPDSKPGYSRNKRFLATVWHGLVHIPKLLLVLSIAIGAGAVWYTLIHIPNDHQKSLE